MAISQQKRNAVLKARQQRSKKTGALPASVVKPLTMKHRERNRYTNEFAGVLMSIETTIVEAWHRNAKLDDAAVSSALKSAILKSEPTDAARDLSERLDDMVPNMDWLDESDWIDGLRAIYTSVRDRSNKSNGSTKYLSYAEAFLRNPHRS